jgi:hypothetical protein
VRIDFVEPEAAHVEAMAGRFRPADIAEVWAVSHKSPEQAILDGIPLSPLCWTVLIDGVPVAVLGVSTASLLGGLGHPWMLGTTDLDHHAYQLVRKARPIVAVMLGTFGHLVNFVDARNTKAIAWLKRLGFRFSEAEPYGVDGLPFYRFEMEA